MSKEKKYIRVTDGGRVYVETEDLFKSGKVQSTIHNLMDSDLIKKIDSNKKKTAHTE